MQTATATLTATATATAPVAVLVDTRLLEQAHTFRQRATSLRVQADALDPMLAETYRRRASELELEAFVSELQSGVSYDLVQLPAA